MTKKTKAPPPEPAPPLRLEWRSPAELAENPANWRRHPDAQLAALTDVIGEVGWAGACLLNERTDRLIDGHARKKVALDQGTELVPVLVGYWTEEQERKILATLDPLAAMAEADAAALDALLRDVQTGSTAIREMLDGLSHDNPPAPPEPGGGGDEFDATPEDGPTRTAAGDLWVIGGKHRLLVGDCTVPENVDRLLGGEKAVLCNTDPPYGIDYVALKDGIPRSGYAVLQGDWGDIQNDTLTDGPKLQEFLERFVRTAVPHLADNAAWYLWHPMLTQGTFFAAAAAADILIHRQIIWVKPGFCLTRSGMYHWKHELCFYGWRRGHQPPWYGDKSQVSVWEVGRDDDAGQHPTQKPVELFARPIANHTRPGEVIYEPFAGSGSQFIAAHRSGRRCHGCELSPRYADVILRRAEAEGLTCEKHGG